MDLRITVSIPYSGAYRLLTPAYVSLKRYSDSGFVDWSRLSVGLLQGVTADSYVADTIRVI